MPLRSINFLKRRRANPIGSLSCTRIRKGIRCPFPAPPSATGSSLPVPPPPGAASPLDLVAPAAAAPAVAAPAAPAAAAAPATPVGLGTGLVDGQGPAVHLLAVEGRDGRLSRVVTFHFHEAEALGTAGVPVHDDLGRSHGAMRFE